MKDSMIEWCHDTANLWWGCHEVHAGCDNCYARVLDNRWKGGHWGPHAPRRIVRSVWKDQAWIKTPPVNVMYGTSVVNQETADRLIPQLLQVRGKHFLSCEPLLGPVDLSQWFGLYEVEDGKYALKVGSRWKDSPDWVIAGGESGHGARPMHPDWVRGIRDQCAAADVPFFFKQWGEWADDGGYPVRVGKKLAGRLLDGVEHNAFPI